MAKNGMKEKERKVEKKVLLIRKRLRNFQKGELYDREDGEI